MKRVNVSEEILICLSHSLILVLVLTFASIFITKLTEASKSQKIDSKFSTKTKTTTKTVQNILRYSSLKSIRNYGKK